MTRVVINMDAQGGFTIYSDEPIQFFVVSDHTPDDRVYQAEVETGVEKVHQQLRSDPVGHGNDSHALGEGYGPRKRPSKPKLELVKA